MNEQNEVFKTLSKINVNSKTEKKEKLIYLSWTWAWQIVKEHYPCASYEVIGFEGKPYLFDEDLGYMVKTSVTIKDETIHMHLPVMDSKNKAMKNLPYKYTTKYGEKHVQKASMFDINKTIMRCLVKNLAMFGLGLYIYAGEDLPEIDEDEINNSLKDMIEIHGKIENVKDFDNWHTFPFERKVKMLDYYKSNFK